ncbi:PD-(D/E)XK nuclease family protein [Bordetella hinzii]|uniref:PD-(D/E)XK nuclease family protein n=2 Tax=Bordetella hinzii TaxID=103855 RepID=UPI0039FD833D
MPSLSDLPACDATRLADLPCAGTLVLTVNNRLSRRLTLELAARLRADRQVSELPRILPLSAWLASAADELSFAADAELPAFRLGGFAAQLVWREAILREEAERELLDIDQAARLAMDADMLCDEWRLQIPEAAQTEEYLGFARWRARYRRLLAELDADDANQGYERVLRALRAGELTPPERVVLAGFGEVSPRFARLLAAFEEGGAQLLAWREGRRELAEPGRVLAADHGAEWRAAAAWAAQRLRAHPNGRYAIVSSQLESEAPFARRVLMQALQGAPGQPDLPFNVGVGRPLIEWPALRAALAWLQALAEMGSTGKVAAPVLGAALLAGHCAGDRSERHAGLDARWRRLGRVSVSEAAWRGDLQYSPRLAQAWEAAMKIWREGPTRAPCDIWTPRIREALKALGFPGEQALDSVGYQVMGALGELLGDFAALAPAAGPLNGRAAVRLLASAARAGSFQPQRDPQARLDVLGLLEAEGGSWDGVWMLGLTDEVLPASPKPNPLLPLGVLRQAGAPRATPEREREWAENIYAALRACAPELVVSCAEHDGERELRPSPLIADAPLLAAAPRRGDAAPAWPLQSLVDESGPPLDPGGESTGGLDVLDTQARNPQWAFVRHRLGARELAPYAQAAAQNVRGQFLHRALELAWRMLPDQEALHLAMSEGRLAALLREAVQQAADEALSAYAPALRGLECARAETVLARWMALEARRLPFTVDQVEADHRWRRGALSLKLRLDRMDRLADGRAVILDYKTGSAQARPEADWSRDRPINLQLPFYAAVLAGDTPDARVAGLLLGQVHARNVGAQGLAEEDLGIEGVRVAADSEAFAGRSWEQILADWRRAIETLADEYARGHAPNVAWGRDDLKYCDAMPFLRLHLDDDEA